ncbi:hypothetical protein Sme01_46050 [Sphaerisporangium melleum]|uniref:Uncharacterized protein n=1 Tax=Sphaerisporangium melleum TaxID=321316 RepID=A0A917VHY6_9ACTN|nr:hypothetical protein [Sphaerisporangium melleum]GGK79790.1 hypothetical protein GCM10007964_23030 [Sphaerisporangium melleum]GII72129.1 hypothetical protein Sme01_46050 [Sphaerisporangium melleum]
MNDDTAPAWDEPPDAPDPAGTPPPETADPVVDLDGDRPVGDTPQAEPGTAENGPPRADGGEDTADATAERLEGDEADADDEDAHTARMNGLRARDDATHVSGEHAHVFQAGHLSYFGGEVRARPRHGPLPSAFITRLKETYAETPSAELLLEALGHSPVQCYVGAPNQGRTTAAIATAIVHLESSGRSTAGNLRILASERGLSAIDAGTVPKGCALILFLGPDEPAPDLAWFAPIAADLRTLKSILIIVTANEPGGSGSMKDDWVVAHRPPTPKAVFGRHLAAGLRPHRAREILSLPAVEREVLRCVSPRQAAALAAQVLTAVRNDVPDDELVSLLDPTEHLRQADAELNGGDLWRKSFLICATVLHRQPAGTVAREAARFAALHVTDAGDGDLRQSEWFTGPMSTWSRCVEFADDTSGNGAGRSVRLTHESLETRILEMVWQDHLGERDTLMRWLGELGHHPRAPVRVKAAHAAAKLACYDFDVIIRELIQPWAADGGYRPRQTAAWALEWLGESGVAKRTRGLVGRWAREGRVQTRATAIAAYGTLLGAQDPDEALRAMREVAGGRSRRGDGRRDPAIDRAERELSGIVQQALLNVFRDGDEEKTVQELAEWTRLPHRRWRQAAARCLLRLASYRGRDSGWPRLAELAADQPRVRHDLTRLWCNALSPDQSNEKAWDALRQWLLLAGSGKAAAQPTVIAPGLDVVVKTLLAGIAADPAIRRSLDFHLRLWRFRDDRRQAADTI